MEINPSMPILTLDDLRRLVKRGIAFSMDYVFLNIILYGLVALVLDSESLFPPLAFFIGVLYQVGFLLLNNGQTPGKAVMGLRVVKHTDAPITLVDVIVRYTGYHINTLLFFTGWLWILVDKNSRGFHEYLSGTRVDDA